MFARAVDNDDAIKNALANVIFLSMDCEKGEGPEIAKLFKVRGYPTFTMVNTKGEVTSSWIGYPGAEKWAGFVAAGNLDKRTISEKQAAYEKSPNKDLACALANNASVAADYAGALKYFRKARELDPANASDYTGEILGNLYYGSRGGAFTLDEVEAEAKAVMVGSSSSPENKIDAALLVRNLAASQDQTERAIPFIKQALAASAGIEELAEARVELEIDEALFIIKDEAKAVALKRESYGEGWLEEPGKLNNFAWWCFENNVNLAEAEEMALRGVELAQDDQMRSNILDTAAEICSARGDCDQAIARIKQAIALSPDKQYYKDQLARFEKEKADKKS